MNKNAIKKFATEARRELISRVSQRALKYGISEKEVGNPNDDSVGGHLLSVTEKKQRAALIAQIQEKGYEQVMEEVAYTWFNRFSALRFMEVNGYLPSRVRVFTDENNAFKPQILTEAIHMELDGLDMEKVYAYKEANDDDDLYKYLLITQCNALNSVLPGMFQKIADYTELLFPDNLLREGSVVQQMIELIPEEDWKDAVQIIGWLYQYYNSEKKDDVFAALKKNVKITKENIPAATQLFTPDWIVRYMVENSLGRLWVEGHPNDELKSQWKYYLEEAEQEPKVQAQLAEIHKEYAALTPDQLKVIDPCSGSGHILAYLFDVLMQIYESYGYTTREAVASIVENNLYGLDIDDRAAQLTYFSVMMKACQYDKRFLRRKVQPHVYAIVESNHVDPNVVDYFCNGDAKLKEAMDIIIDELHDAKEYGSIITVSQQDWDALYARFEEIKTSQETSLYQADILALRPLVQVAKVLSRKYDVVVTNPPYMGSKGMSARLLQFIQKYYPECKADLYAAFIMQGNSLLKRDGFIGLITPYLWMYLSSFEKLRKHLNTIQNIISLIQLEYNAFEVATVPVCTYVLRKSQTKYKGRYIQLSSFKGWENQEPHVKSAIKDFNQNYCFEINQSKFSLISGSPIAYWLTDSMYKVFEKGEKLKKFGMPRQGMATADNNRFMRLWHEVNVENVDFKCTNRKNTLKKWYPHSKGGSLRRWYGNNNFIINWKNDGSEIRGFKKAVVRNPDYYFKSGITWSDLTISWFTARYVPNGFTFDSAGPTYFLDDASKLNYFCGYFNSWVFQELLNISCQGMHYSNGVIAELPIIFGTSEEVLSIEKLVEQNISISRKDWNECETSWEFEKSPYLPNKECETFENCVNREIEKKQSDVETLRHNENRINRMFADIFSVQDVIPSKGICEPTLRQITKNKAVKEFISYAVGCLFGRYSMDVFGLAYAGGIWNSSKYQTCPAEPDNIIPICDDEYFQDDMVGRFVSFIEAVYGKEHIEENMTFIASALGGKGQPRDVIRKYFLNDFYKDHCKTYQKRPIYWLFDSGKKNGFKALIYMHRYQPDTIARIRTDYVHEQQARYRTAIADLEQRIADASTSERVKLNKKLKALNDQAAEIHTYEEKIHHLADQMISIDLDDGVKKNYAIFQDVLAKIK